jgi:hypothetical protein
MLDRVVGKIGDRSEQKVPIADNRRLFGLAKAKADGCLLRRRVE